MNTAFAASARVPKARLDALKTAAIREDLRSLTAWLLLAGIRFYQAVFAPAMPAGCKFYPSCSHYAAEAIARHGAARGAWLAAARLWRCRPFTQGGFDPVPDVDQKEERSLEERKNLRSPAEEPSAVRPELQMRRFQHSQGLLDRARNEVGS